MITDEDRDFMALMALQNARKPGNYGFLTADDVKRLAVSPRYRFTPCLVRCSCGRFTCAAQYVEELVDVINRDAVNYVRDISLTV